MSRLGGRAAKSRRPSRLPRYPRPAMLEHLRNFFTRLITPVARLLLRLGVSPDMVPPS